MEPRELVKKWVDVFNKANAEALAAFYAGDAINSPGGGRSAVGKQTM